MYGPEGGQIRARANGAATVDRPKESRAPNVAQASEA